MLFSLAFRLLLIKPILALCLSKAINFSGSEAGNKLLGEGVGDRLA
jgi:uncharacterized membrane protein